MDLPLFGFLALMKFASLNKKNRNPTQTNCENDRLNKFRGRSILVPLQLSIHSSSQNRNNASGSSSYGKLQKAVFYFYFIWNMEIMTWQISKISLVDNVKVILQCQCISIKTLRLLKKKFLNNNLKTIKIKY